MKAWNKIRKILKITFGASKKTEMTTLRLEEQSSFYPDWKISPALDYPIRGHKSEKVLRFMDMVETVASYSKDPSTKVGAIALSESLSIRSTGWNGFSKGVNDDIPERWERPAKYDWVIHAERNLISQAAEEGRSLKGSIVLVGPLFPCKHCADDLIQSGVKTVIAPRSTHEPWISNEHIPRTKFKEAGVEVITVDKDSDGVWRIIERG